LQEEAAAFQLFQADQVRARLRLSPDEYFDRFETVAFRKVSDDASYYWQEGEGSVRFTVKTSCFGKRIKIYVLLR
jgi:hypothetical protein